MVTRRKSRAALVCALFLTGLALRASADAPVVTWVFWQDCQPLCWEEFGTPQGLEVEIAERVFARLGIGIVCKFYPWARAQKMVESGEADMMMTTPNDGRFKYAYFGKEMTLPNYWTIYVKKGRVDLLKKAAGFTRLEDLKAYSLADFIGNGWQAAYMKTEDGYAISSQVGTMAMVPLMLANGRVDMIINSENWVDWWAEKQGISGQIEKVDTVLPNTRFHFVAMLSRKSPWVDKGILRAFDEELRKMKKTGEWLQILSKYRDPYASGKPFKTQIDDSKYLVEYDKYPVYKP